MESSSGDHESAAESFMTVAEVARRLRVSKMTVYRLLHGGEVESVKIGRSFRVTEDAVDEYLRKSFYQAG